MTLTCLGAAPAIPVAHAGHFLWLIYVPPLGIVIWVTIRSLIEQRRQARREREGD